MDALLPLPDDQPSPAEAARILLARQRATQSLLEYARLIDIPGVPASKELDDDEIWEVVETPLAAHHELMLTTMQDLLEDRLVHKGQTVRRMMLMLPPGSAKSTYATVVTPSWYMGRNPGREVILAGYGDTIVKKHGKRARQICASAQFEQTFGTSPDPKTQAANEWALMNGSSYKAAGITAGITGFRTSLLIWDDLIKGRKDADSPGIRNDVWLAYIDDARSRKTPRAHEIGVGTRWHEDDHMGRILPEGYNGESGFIECRDGNIWLVLCCAAECEREDDPLGREVGEMIWPEWFDEDYWRDKRVVPRSWASLYQQRPAPEEGIYFTKDKIRRYTELPEYLDRYIAFDPAVTAEADSASADATSIQVWGVDSEARLYLIDEWHDRVTMDVWVQELLTLVSMHKPLEVISESGIIRRASEPFIAREGQRRKIFALYEYVHRHGDKEAMARPFQAMVNAGQVYLPNNSVGDKMQDEMLRFPTSKEDHRVDAGTNLCLRLEHIWASNPPREEKKVEKTISDPGLLVSDLMPPRFTRKKSRYAF